MTERKQLGRITKAAIGFGGYQDAMFGLSVQIGGPAWGVNDFDGCWATWSEGCQWTEESQSQELARVCRRLRDLLRAAKVQDVAGLVGVPVECTMVGNRLISWRILTEVI